jgi:hypothetical protein
MRNLSLEAAKLAERDFVAQYPQLASKPAREALTDHQKQQILDSLLLTASMYEAQLIAEIS